MLNMNIIQSAIHRPKSRPLLWRAFSLPARVGAVVTLLLSLIVSSPIFAQTAEQATQPVTTASPDHAKSELQTRLLALSSYSADFTQQVFDINGELLQDASGLIRLQQPQRLYWKMQFPNEDVLIADGTTLWHIDPFVEQVVALDQAKSVTNHPIILIAEPKSSLWAEYQVSRDKQRFVVTPITDQGNITQLVIAFNEQEALSGLEMTDQQQQRNVLSFKNIQQNSRIPASVFQFNMPEGFDFDDQR